MKNINKTAYYACHIDNSRSAGNYLSVTPSLMPGKTFSFDLWFYMEARSCPLLSHTILSQENGFSFGIEGELICFSHPSTGKITVRSDIIEFNSDEWVHIFVTYDSEKLVFSLNGIPVKSVSCPDKTFLLKKNIKIGEEFTGYIRSFRLYDHAIKEENYKKYIYQATYTNETEMPYLCAFIDCNTEDIRSLGPHEATVKVVKACGIVDLVPVYRPSKGKYASLPNAESINPGGFFSGASGIYVKAYLRPVGTCREQVIFANGNFDDSDCLIIYTRNEKADAFTLCFRLGEQTFVSSREIKAYQWVDIILNHSKDKVTVYLNGEEEIYSPENSFTRESPGNVRIGNSFDTSSPSDDFTCEHYIFMAAVFDKILDQTDAGDFLENHPFIFEDNLVALYSFDAGMAIEQISCQNILLDKSDLLLVQRTNDGIPTEAYKYRINRTPAKVSSISAWQAETMYTAYIEYYNGFMDLLPVVGEAEKRAILNRIASDPAWIEENMELFIREELTREIVADSVSSLKEPRIYQLNRMLKPNTPANISSAGYVSMNFTAAVAAGGKGIAAVSSKVKIMQVLGEGLMTLVVLSVMAKVAEEIKDKPDDDDDDDDDNKVSLKILELTFQHAPDNYTESAVRFRNADGPVNGPEWTTSNKDTASALYIGNEIGTVKIKATVQVRDTRKEKKEKYQVSLTGYAKDSSLALFNYFEYKGILSHGENKDVILTAKNTNFPVDSMLVREMVFCWNYEIDRYKNTTYNTKLNVYVIPRIPAFPIELDGKDPERLLYKEFLDFIFEAESKPIPSFGEVCVENVTSETLEELTNLIYNHPKLRYEAGSFAPFVNIQMTEIPTAYGNIGGQIYSVHVNQMMRALNAPGEPVLHIECTMFACILVYLFWISGVAANMVGIQHPNRGQQLMTNRITPSKGIPGQHSFNNHVIVEVLLRTNESQLSCTKYYDASCKVRIGEEDQTLATLDFSYVPGPVVSPGDAGSYRGLFFQPGTQANITTVYGLNPLQIVFA